MRSDSNSEMVISLLVPHRHKELYVTMQTNADLDFLALQPTALDAVHVKVGRHLVRSSSRQRSPPPEPWTHVVVW